MIGAVQIGKALQHATFPIRSFEELHNALQQHLSGGEHCEACELVRMASLFSPRDFLFTNAGQVERIVAARQCVLVDDENDIH